VNCEEEIDRFFLSDGFLRVTLQVKSPDVVQVVNEEN
jgi:hypothetical protein